jgi:hypothetical protein
MKVLFVLTSHSELGTQEKNRILGWRICSTYYELADGVEIDIATPLGGHQLIQKWWSAATEDTKRFDRQWPKKIHNKLTDVKKSDYDAGLSRRSRTTLI